jgi:hypothetical protein
MLAETRAVSWRSANVAEIALVLEDDLARAQDAGLTGHATRWRAPENQKERAEREYHDEDGAWGCPISC